MTADAARAIAWGVHKILARHNHGETCPECEWHYCRHCQTVGRIGEDHTCTCPHPDETCPDHPAPRGNAS